MILKIKISDFDKEALDSATQKDFEPELSLKAICGEILIKAYKEVKK